LERRLVLSLCLVGLLVQQPLAHVTVWAAPTNSPSTSYTTNEKKALTLTCYVYGEGDHRQEMENTANKKLGEVLSGQNQVATNFITNGFDIHFFDMRSYLINTVLATDEKEALELKLFDDCRIEILAFTEEKNAVVGARIKEHFLGNVGPTTKYFHVDSGSKLAAKLGLTPMRDAKEAQTGQQALQALLGIVVRFQLGERLKKELKEVDLPFSELESTIAIPCCIVKAGKPSSLGLSRQYARIDMYEDGPSFHQGAFELRAKSDLNLLFSFIYPVQDKFIETYDLRRKHLGVPREMIFVSPVKIDKIITRPKICFFYHANYGANAMYFLEGDA